MNSTYPFWSTFLQTVSTGALCLGKDPPQLAERFLLLDDVVAKVWGGKVCRVMAHTMYIYVVQYKPSPVFFMYVLYK